MNNTPDWDTVRAAVREAREINDRIGNYADAWADLTFQNLRRVRGSTLAAIKAALRNFDAGTKKWKH